MNTYKAMVLVFGAALIFPSTKLQSVAFAFDTPMTRSSLRGLPGIFLLVQGLNPEIEREGLTQDQIQSDIESKLRTAKIKLLSKEQYAKTPGTPLLHVVPAILKVTVGVISLYTYTVIVRVSQSVHLVRKPAIETPGFTWTSEGTCGAVRSAGDIRSKIVGEVDKFISAYIAVNPK